MFEHRTPMQTPAVRFAFTVTCALTAAPLGCATPPSPAAAAPTSSTPAAREPTTPSAPRTPEPAPARLSAAVPYSWKNVQILGGGFVTGIVFHPTEPDLVYARTDIGGAYRYSKGDKAWIPLLDILGRDEAPYWGVESIALDPLDANKVYLACGMYSADWAPTGAFLRSSDRGKTWQVVPVQFKFGGNENGRSNGERLVVDPNHPNILFFGSRKAGLYTSTDAGQTWNPVAGFPKVTDTFGNGISFVLPDAASGKKGRATPHIYAGVTQTDPSLYESKDGGVTWNPVAKQPTGLLPNHGVIDAKRVLYVSYGNHPGPSDVTDGAVHKLDIAKGAWINITPLAPTANGDDKFGYGGLGLDRQKPGTLVVSTIDRWAKGDEIFRTTNGGRTWTKVASAARFDANGAAYLTVGKAEVKAPHWMGDIEIDPKRSDRAMFITGAGIFATENLTQADKNQPTTWKFLNHGLEETAVGVLVSPPAGPPLLSGVGDICGFRHDDLDVSPPQGAYLNPACNGTSGLDFAERNPSFVVRVGTVWHWNPGAHGAYSTDGGATWKGFGSEPSAAKLGGRVVVTADGSHILWSLRGAQAVVSADRGVKWTPVKGLPAGAEIPDWANIDIQPAADRVNPGKVYVLDAMNGVVYRSTDRAVSFTQTATSLPSKADWERAPCSIATVPGHEGHVWITTGNGLHRSTDSAASFVQVPGIEEAYAIGFGKPVAAATYPTIFLLGKIDGKKAIFRSDDQGATFARINDDDHQFAGATHIAGDPRVEGRVYVGSSGRGIFYGTPAARSDTM
jgi:xyloglucan-specific exo-beta-1,4-glucanase